MTEPRQITQGLLDALVLTPIVDGDPPQPMMLAIEIRGLPGFRGSLQIGAVHEVQDALNTILGPRDTPELALLVRKMFEVYDRPCKPNGDWEHGVEYSALVDQVRRLVGAPPRKDSVR